MKKTFYLLIATAAIIATLGIMTTQVQAQVPNGCTGDPHDRDAPTGNPHDAGEGGNPHDNSHHHHGEGGDTCPGAQ